MTTLLHISASPRDTDSFSRGAGRAALAALRHAIPVSVVTRDLAKQPPGLPDATFARASVKPPEARNAADTVAFAESERLIAELAAADIVLIDTPMHNFTVPAVLKAWVDNVVRPGRTFESTPHGKRGLLHDRPVLLFVASASFVEDGMAGHDGATQTDFLTPYLRYIFATMGVTNFHPVLLDGLRRADNPAACIDRWLESALPPLLGHIATALSPPK